MQQLASELDISLAEVKMYAEYARQELRRDSGMESDNATSNQGQLINQHLEVWGWQFPTRNEFRRLQKSTGFPTGRLHRILARRIAQRRRRQLTDGEHSHLHATVKRLVQAFIAERGPLDNARLSRQLYEQLEREVDTDRFNLYKIVRQVIDPPARFTSEHKLILRKWSKKNGYQAPTSEEIEMLHNQTRLGRHQISVHLWKIRQRRVKIIPEQRLTIEEYFERYGNDVKQHLQEIQTVTKLSQTQISTVIHRLRVKQARRTLTRQQKKYIQQFAEEDLPEECSLEEVGAKTGLHVEQIRQAVKEHKKKLSRGIITNSNKVMIFGAFQQFHRLHEPADTVTDDSKSLLGLQAHFRRLAEEHALSIDQVRELYRHWSDPPQALTQHKKKLLQDWMRQHGKPTQSNHFDELQRLTQLSRIQISDLIRQVADPLQTITESKRHALSEWMQQNNFEMPTNVEKAKLQNELQLARRQLTRLIREIRAKHAR